MRQDPRQAGDAATPGASCLAAALLTAAALSGGCRAYSDTYNLRYAPDGRTIAFAYSDVLGNVVPVGWYGLTAVTHYVRIWRTDPPRQVRSIRICGGLTDTFTGYRYKYYVEDLGFSPESGRRAAERINDCLEALPRIHVDPLVAK